MRALAHGNSCNCTLTLWGVHSRALEFIGVFLADVLTGQPDLSKCAKKAYESTLKKYHGWMVQGIFSVSLRDIISMHLLSMIILKHNCGLVRWGNWNLLEKQWNWFSALKVEAMSSAKWKYFSFVVPMGISFCWPFTLKHYSFLAKGTRLKDVTTIQLFTR